MTVTCKNCGPGFKVEVDDQLGHIACVNCGNVIEENAMVSEVGFVESTGGRQLAEGYTIKHGQKRARGNNSKGGLGRNDQDSQEVTKEKGYNAIEDAAARQELHLPGPVCEKAKRYFDIALANRFTKGRNANCVIAACCYIACRMEKTAHFIIDFADAFQTNVFQIGSVFLKLRQLVIADADTSLPLIDPSLFMGICFLT